MISIVDDLILFNYIDSGCFAEIYLSKKQDSNILLATKKISLKYISVEPLFKTSLQNEINFLKELNHPNIIKLYEVKIKPDYIYLIMEYCNGGSLKKALNNYKAKYGKPFSEEIVKYLMQQILLAVDYLHSQGIVHRDLKLDNILLKYNNNNNIGNINEIDELNIFQSEIKIIDFNISTRAKKITQDDEILLNDDYEDNNFNKKIDIWYLGLLCYEMLFGEKLSGSENNNGHIINQPYVIIPQSISLEAQTFLLSMLQTDSKKRLSAKELLKHNFLQKNESTNKLSELNINPDLSNLNNLNNLNNSNSIIIDNKSNTAKKLSKKNFGLSNTPVNRNKYKTIIPENRLRFSAKLSKPNHKKFQAYIYENSTNNSNNNNNLIHNKTEPLIGPKLKKESKIRNIINLKNNNVIKNKPNNINNNRINNKINTNKNNNNNVSEHICKIINVGKNINNNQFKIIIDASIKACLTLNGKIMTATKAANDIKKLIGDNWLVFISNINNKDYDFCISAGKKDDYVSFSLDDKLFQIYKYN